MKMNEKIIRYLDGDILSEEKTNFEKEISDSTELKQQLISVSNTLEKTKTLMEAEITNDYFVNMIPAFRKKQITTRERILNPAYAGSAIMILTFLITMFLQNSLNTNTTVYDEISEDDFNQNDISSLLSNINYDNNEFDLSPSDEMNIDSLINIYLTNDILTASGNGSSLIQDYEFNPDEFQLSDIETENLYSVIMNKKFF